MTNNDQFPFYLRRSFYIHMALFLLTLIGGKVILSKAAELRNKNIELIQASVQVDMVAMPKYTLEELKRMETTPAPEAVKEEVKEVVKEEVKAEVKAEVAPVASNNDFLEAQKHQNFKSLLKQLSDQKIAKKNSSKSSNKEVTDLKTLVLAGNKLSKGSQAYGDNQGADLTAFQAYISRLPARVKPFWRLPSFLLDKKLKCRVRVWIAMNGQVTRSEIYQSSGDSEYDQKALDAVNAASPFPALTAEFGKRALNGDILLGFPL